jgi:hypothetical protein
MVLHLMVIIHSSNIICLIQLSQVHVYCERDIITSTSYVFVVIVEILKSVTFILLLKEPYLCNLWNFTSFGIPFSEYSAILAKSLPNKIPEKFHLLRKFPQNSIHSGLRLNYKLARNPPMCLVHN